MQTSEPLNEDQQEHNPAEGQEAQAAPATDEDTQGFLSLGLPAYPMPAPQPVPLPRPSVDFVPLGPPGGGQLIP